MREIRLSFEGRRICMCMIGFFLAITLLGFSRPYLDHSFVPVTSARLQEVQVCFLVLVCREDCSPTQAAAVCRPLFSPKDYQAL